MTTTTTDEHPVFYCRECGWTPEPANPWQCQSSDRLGCFAHKGCPDEPRPGDIWWDYDRSYWRPAAERDRDERQAVEDEAVEAASGLCGCDPPNVAHIQAALLDLDEPQCDELQAMDRRP